jgi:excisionase family DNA binding protein
MVMLGLYTGVVMVIYSPGEHMSDQDYLTADQAADYLGVKRQRVYNLVSEGRLGQRVDGYLVFTKPELDEYIAQRATRPKGGRPTFHTRPKEKSSPAVR